MVNPESDKQGPRSRSPRAAKAADSPGSPRFAVQVGPSQPVKTENLHKVVGLDAQSVHHQPLAKRVAGQRLRLLFCTTWPFHSLRVCDACLPRMDCCDDGGLCSTAGSKL